jgi:hypothetical protein
MKGPRTLPGLLFLLLLWKLPVRAAVGSPDTAIADPTGYPVQEGTHTVESSQVVLYWNCARPDPGRLRVEGAAVSPSSEEPVQFLGFDLVGMDGDGHTISSARIDARNSRLRTNQPALFTIDLRTTGTEQRFNLYYQYVFEDRGHNPFFSMAAWDGAVPSHHPPLFLAWTNQFMVRDACSPTQHLVH